MNPFSVFSAHGLALTTTVLAWYKNIPARLIGVFPLFADDICEFPSLIPPGAPELDGFREAYRRVAEEISAAQRFVIEPGTVATAQDVALSKPSSIIKALEFARVPAPLTWMEWSGWAKRSALAAHGIPFPEERGPQPYRVGALLRSDKSGNGFRATIFWNHHDLKEPNMGLHDLVYDGHEGIGSHDVPDGVREEISAMSDSPLNYYNVWKNNPPELEALMRIAMAAGTERSVHFEKLILPFIAFQGPDAALAIAQAHEHDVGEEFPLIVAILILMNTVNGTESRASDLSRLNASRARKGKSPLLEHHTVVMRVPKRLRSRGTAPDDHGSRKAFHWQQGHFKHRTSGDGSRKAYWWSGHYRGDPEKGTARTDHLVRAAPLPKP